MEAIRRIDINEWSLSGGGARGDSYFHKTDPTLMVKFDNSGVPVQDMLQEVEIARIVASLGLPTPEPGDVVTDGKRYGITFRRIVGKRSYARLVGTFPQHIPAFAAAFAKLAKQMHSTRGAGCGLRHIKDIYSKLVAANPHRSKELIDKTLRLLDSLEEADTCVHGDFHYGNVIVADGRNYLIDLGNFAYGHPYFDLAMMFAVYRLGLLQPQFAQHMFHCTTDDATMFWQCFLKEYFGPDVPQEQAEGMIMPYYAVRMMTMEAETGDRIPDIAIEKAMQYLSGRF